VIYNTLVLTDLRSLKQHLNWIPQPRKPLKWCCIYESSPSWCQSQFQTVWHGPPLGQIWCF